MKDKLMQTLGQFSQAILAPLTYLPAAGLLLAVGALLTSAPLSQVFPVLEWAPVRLVGQLLYQGMLAVLHQLAFVRGHCGSPCPHPAAGGGHAGPDGLSGVPDRLQRHPA